jgi:hypothetical protein
MKERKEIICKNCNSIYIFKYPNQKYCSKKCRLDIFSKNQKSWKDFSGDSYICATCHIEKNKSEFFKRKNRKIGIMNSCKACSINRCKNRYHTDINHRLAEICRNRIREALHGITKSIKTFELLGCSTEELKLYLEKQFMNNMNWDNYGYYGWHIDHIKPCSSFNLIDIEEQKKCFHFSNLQPLWSEENLKKGNKYE